MIKSYFVDDGPDGGIYAIDKKYLLPDGFICCVDFESQILLKRFETEICLLDDVEKEIKQIKRQLWIERAKAARYAAHWWFSSLSGISPHGEKMIGKWRKVEQLCLKKAKELEIMREQG